MRLPWWGEGPAVGLSSVMLQLPFRMLGTKLLWWTWHDTDPTIEDRMFWTPWSSLYYYAACACSFVWMLRLTRRLLLEKEYDWMKFPKELTCSFLTGVLSYWLGTAQFKTHDSIVNAGVNEDHTLCVLADLTDANDRKKLIDSTISKWGRLNILVNSAGASITHGKEGFEASEDSYKETMEINLNSVLQMVQLARPYLIKSEGEVVNVSSISGLQFGIVLTPYYAISKAGLDQLTRALAIDLIQYGVRVNGVSPGLVKTSFAERTGLTKEQSDKLHDFYGSEKHSCPRGKYAEPSEIANVIAFLADRQISSFIVGQSIVVDGGMSLIMGAYAFDYKKVIST
ncbi:unnamed protein product [Cylicocyclus nassatus]|uniref:DUF7802 domain-containing protein n=1 Tax=Cylicocyclus nassatus TaxID=53992 RepID=A0AA36H838_CYLNA|nr:unnamed protein product [Cylicocyclus nassatus]